MTELLVPSGRLRHRPECWGSRSPSLLKRTCAKPHRPSACPGGGRVRPGGTWATSQESELTKTCAGSSPKTLAGELGGLLRKGPGGGAHCSEEGEQHCVGTARARVLGEELRSSLQIRALAFPTSAGKAGPQGGAGAGGLNGPPHVLTALGTASHPRVSSLTARSGDCSLLGHGGVGAACQDGGKGCPVRKE